MLNFVFNCFGKTARNHLNSVSPKHVLYKGKCLNVYELTSQKRQNNDFDALFNDVLSISNKNGLIVNKPVNWLIYSIKSTCIDYTQNYHYNLTTPKHQHIIRMIIIEYILVGSVKEKSFLDGS